MEFDRRGLEGGVEIYTSIQNGKAMFECKVHLKKTWAEEYMTGETEEDNQSPEGAYLNICVWDREERLLFYCRHFLEQEEPVRGMLLHYHLWQGVEDPYLYRIRVALMEREDYAADVWEGSFALRTIREIPGKGWFLNEMSFLIRPVAYVIPSSKSYSGLINTNVRDAMIRRDLGLMCQMGANTVCPIGGEIDREFYQICDEMGLMLWWKDWNQSGEKSTGRVEIPRFHGTVDSLLAVYDRLPTEQYYFYKACWSKEPFVYISVNSLHLANGTAEVTVYSNQKKVALYVEGTLFEFRTEGPDFVFQEIPVKRLPMLLTAEAGECCMSVEAMPFQIKRSKNIKR